MGKNDTFLNAQMGDYRLQEVVAVGGMARVYLGFDQKLERRAAVKVLELNQDWVDETIIQRFEREAKSVAALEHDNIITIYQYGEYEGAYFLAMQYIDGSDLRRILKDATKANKRLPVERVIKIMRQVASALDFAHAAGIVHRDIKPSNILVTSDDKAVLTDFGLVLRNTDSTMGTAFGTPRYIAPEQAIASQQAVAQSDIYSFAVIMYEMLTGDTPFDGETPMEIALAHVSDIPDRPSVREPSIPKAVDDAIMKALDKDPELRPKTAAEFVEAVAEGYGLQGKAVLSAPPAAPPPTPKVEKKTSRFTPQPKQQPAVPSPVVKDAKSESSESAVKPAEEKPQKSKRSRVPLLLLILILLVGGGGGYYLFTQGKIGTPGAEVTLYYDDITFVIFNGGNYDLEQTPKLDFVRGAADAGRDDYNGDRIPGDIIPVSECYRIALQGRSALEPPQCSNINTGEFLNNQELFFWRTEPVSQATFEVRWEGRVVTRCETISRGGVGECRFNYPWKPDR